MSWRHPKLAATMDPWADWMFGSNVWSLTSMDLQKLHDTDTMLRDLNTLDANGAFFTSDDMLEAFKLMAAPPGRSAKLAEMAQASNISMSELMQIYAYKLRIMLAYRRRPSKPPPVCSDPHKDPPPKRLREDLEDDEQEFEKHALEKVYQPIVLYRYFNGITFEAMELLSDGRKKKADIYIQGPTGFAVAMFGDYKMVLQVPNTCVSPERRLVQHQSEVAGKSKSKGQAKTAAMLKKPGAASTDGHGESEKAE